MKSNNHKSDTLSYDPLSEKEAVKRPEVKSLLSILDNLCDENPVKMEYILDNMYSEDETREKEVNTKASSFQKMLQNELYD